MSPTRTLEVTPEVVKEDGQNRVAKTAGQAGTAGSVVIIALWVAQQIGWDGTMPPEVIVAATSVLTAVFAGFTNLGKLRGKM